jgi:REP element-mobilizing transposase RayT
MAQSLAKIYLHVIFHTKVDSPTIGREYINRVHQYVGKLVNTTGCQVLSVGGTENHVHALVILSKSETVAHLIEEMKRNSSRWIKTLSPVYEKFSWQGGYAAFSVSQSQVDNVIRYINNQENHHKKQSFKEEYIEFLKLYHIDYDEKYVLSD